MTRTATPSWWTSTSSDDFIRIQAALAGRYSLQRELGRGGMGIVYLAQDVALDRPVALKLLQPGLASRPALRQRFLTEARTAARLSHPNIVPIFAVDEVAGLVFFVMAFVDGETLEQRIRSRGPLSASVLATILREVGWALAYAHAQGVVHRDVKADNIMLERGSGRALVVDFGIARVMEDPAGSGAGELLGTAEYMSPEQARGGVADQRSDIYALGVVAFYALSGRLPFEGVTAGAVLARQIAFPAPSLAAIVPGLPAALGDAVDRCLAKDPAQRFASAEALADAMGVALAARREAPAAIRQFIRQSSEITHNLLWIGSLQLSLLLLAALDAATPAGLARDVWLGLAVIALAAEPIPLAGLVAHIRRLLKSGYTREDLLAAWHRELQRDAPDRALEFGRTPGVAERAARWAVPFGWACAVGSAILGGFSSGDAALALGTVGLGTAFIGGVFSLWRHDARTALSRRITGAFLRSRVGRWAFGLAGIGLDRTALAAPAAGRPTELAIGLAVNALFDALPKELRRELDVLPGVVRRLEADALLLRQRVEQLDDAAMTPALTQGLQGSRDSAQRRLADAVAALETIRLDLLRLAGGDGSVGSLTADLSDARAVSEQVGRLLAARDQVEAMLASGRGPAKRTPRPRESPVTG